MNNFGGNWTQDKIEILVKYASAYLRIMEINAKKYNWKVIYFDGFAGSGFIEPKKGKKKDAELNQWKLFSEENPEKIVGAAKRILEIEKPRPFDSYLFVEKNKTKFSELIANTKTEFPLKDIRLANEDCNSKIMTLGDYLKTKDGKKYRMLAYIDPCGMQVNWESLVTLKECSVDVWILIPTGMGVNRLLKTTGEITDAWLERLEKFLGMEKQEIIKHFYETEEAPTLFGLQEQTTKTEKAIEKSAELYSKRLKELFKFVSKPYILKNKTNSTMFHFLMVSNNGTAVKIANQIVEEYNKKS